MRLWSLKPSLHNMKSSAAAMRQPLLRTPSSQERGLEQALQPRRRQMSAPLAAATPFMSSKIQLTVRLRLKPPLILHLQPNSPPIGSSVAHSSIQLAGGQERRAERSAAFLKLAERIVTIPDGDFEPSPPPPLLSKLTDEDLVLAADAVEAVAAGGNVNQNRGSGPQESSVSLSRRQGHLLRPPGQTICLVLLMFGSLNGESRVYKQPPPPM